MKKDYGWKTKGQRLYDNKAATERTKESLLFRHIQTKQSS
jgi:hypothetical protein